MKYSIVIPVYNVELYIRECLTSVAEQTFKDYEVVLVDDGSTDDSGRICDDFQKEYNGDCTVIHKANGGPSSARNAGLDVARGEWVVFVDSDDYISDTLLEKLDDSQKEFPADIYMYNIRRVDTNGVLAEKLLFSVENNMVRLKNDAELSDYILNRIVTYSDGWEVCTRCFKKQIIDENRIKFLDMTVVFAEDLCFTMEYMLHIKSLYKLCDILYYYRINPNSLSHCYDQETMLIRLYNLLEHIYTKGRASNKTFAKKMHYFFKALIGHHIRYKMDDNSNEQVEKQLFWIKSNTRYGKKWAWIGTRDNERIKY